MGADEEVINPFGSIGSTPGGSVGSGVGLMMLYAFNFIFCSSDTKGLQMRGARCAKTSPCP